MKKRIYALDRVTIVCADGRDMPFPDASFSLITSNLGINNFPEPEKVIKECYRVCRPGGILALTTNAVGHMQEFYEVFEQVLTDLGLSALQPALAKQIAHRAEKESTAQWIESAGFRIRKIVEDSFSMRYLDGSALFRHSLTYFGFLDGWRSVVPEQDQERVFLEIESRLNDLARQQGEIRMTVPMLYMEAVK